MKKALYSLLIGLALLCGCAPGATASTAPLPTGEPSPAVTISAPIVSQSPASPSTSSPVAETSLQQSATPAAERTPDPSSEMLVTGTVVAVLVGATIEVKADNPGKDLVVTMLQRAEYAQGVSKKFEQGNHVRIITSNKFAKSLPERVAAVLVLENSKK